MSTFENDGSQFSSLPDETRVGTRLHAFSNMVSSIFYNRTEVPFGIALSEWRVLQSAIAMPGTSQGEIAESNGLNVMTVSRAVAGLRRKGLVEANPDPLDRRRSLVFPTDRGLGIGRDIAERASSMYSHVFSVLSEDELMALDDVMDRINLHFRCSELPDPLPASNDWKALMSEGSTS